MINRLLNYKCHPFVFGLYRLSLGLTILIYVALLSNRWIEFYGPFGTSPVKLRPGFAFIRPSIFSYITTESGLWFYYGLTIFMLLAFIFGRLRKIPAIFIWITMISIQNSNSNNVNAEEFILCVFAFYAMIMPINSTLVVNFRTWQWSNSSQPVAAWMLFPFFVHVELIYVISLILKPIFDEAWIDGTLIYLAVNTFDMSRIPGWGDIFKIGHAILSRILTWASLLIEAVFPILVWVERFRIPMIISMAAFQVGIAVLLSGVQFFSLSMINALVLFLPSQKTYDFFQRVWMFRNGRSMNSNDRPQT